MTGTRDRSGCKAWGLFAAPLFDIHEYRKFTLKKSW